MIDKEPLILSLYELGAVQFGEFTLKSGTSSPVYLDLRLLISRPGTLRRVAHIIEATITGLSFDRIAAIPLGGLPIGVALSLSMDRPLIYPRMQEAKQHGTGRYIEGAYKPGETVLLVDDVLSLSHSKLEAINLLEMVRLTVKDLVVVVDREMGGAETLKERGVTVHSLLNLREILLTLFHLRRISEDQYRFVAEWLAEQHGS